MEYLLNTDKAIEELVLYLARLDEFKNLSGETLIAIAERIRDYGESAYGKGIHQGSLKVGHHLFFDEVTSKEQAEEIIRVLQRFKEKEEPKEFLKINFGNDLRFDGEYRKSVFENIKEEIKEVLKKY